MMLGEMARRIAKMVWTTSDVGAEELYKRGDSDQSRNLMLKEYVYLKTGIAARLIFQAADPNNIQQQQEAKDLVSAVLAELKKAFDTSSSYLTYGGNYSELCKRVDEYLACEDLEGVESIFTDSASVGIIRNRMVIVILMSQGYLEALERSIRYELVNFQNGGGGHSGCGCLSVVACVSLLVVAIIAIICF